MDGIENLGDAHEALEECFIVIYWLAGGDESLISNVCQRNEFVDPWEDKYQGDHKEPMKID